MPIPVILSRTFTPNLLSPFLSTTNFARTSNGFPSLKNVRITSVDGSLFTIVEISSGFKMLFPAIFVSTSPLLTPLSFIGNSAPFAVSTFDIPVTITPSAPISMPSGRPPRYTSVDVSTGFVGITAPNEFTLRNARVRIIKNRVQIFFIPDYCQ